MQPYSTLSFLAANRAYKARRGSLAPKANRASRGNLGPKGETGTGLEIKGTYESLEALQAAVTEPSQGDMYNVGAAAPYNVYMWDTTTPPGQWLDQGQLQGAKGDRRPRPPRPGRPPGAQGIQGETGPQGEPGPAANRALGEKGDPGPVFNPICISGGRP